MDQKGTLIFGMKIGDKAKGCLWHVAFGEVGTILAEGEGGNAQEVLEKKGILKEHDFVDGIIFYIEGKFHVCLRDIKQATLLNLCSYMSDMNFLENQTIYKTD